jgi:hypothetical protein
LATLKKSNVKIKPADLNLKKSSRNDALLTQAEQTNQFDEVFVKLMQSELKAYQQVLKNTHEGNNSKSVKAMLATQYLNADKLIATELPAK